MKRRCFIFIFAIVALKLNLLFAQQEKAFTYYNDSSCYDVKSYELQITAVPDSLYLSGSTTILASVVKKPLARFYIQLNNALTVDSVLINGQKCTFEHASNWIKADLPQAVNAGTFLQTIIYYHGDAVSSNPLGGLGIGTVDNDSHGCKVFYTLSEPYSALDFFACKQWVSDKADSLKVYVTTTKPYLAVANGILQKIEDKEANLHTFYWESHYPIAYYLIGFAIGDFNTYSYRIYSTAAKDSILFQNFHCYTDTEWTSLKPQVDRTIDLLHFFESLTGIPYPFHHEKYGQVTVPIGGGMENQTITFLQNFDFTLVAHELAHSWFGNYVTCSDWQNIWINEGFATYLSYLANEQFFPETASDWLITCLNLSLRDSLASIYIPSNKVFDPLRIFSYTNTYMKGAFFLHTLRYFVGSDSVFFGVWKSFLQKYAFGNAGVEEFKSILEEKTQRSWSAFFNEWFYGNGYPIIHIKSRAQNKYLQVQGYIRSSSGDNRYSPIPVPILVQLNQGRDSLIYVTLTDTFSSHSFLFSSAVRGIMVDPQHWLLAKFNVSLAIDTTSLNSIRVFPNPFKECFQVIFPVLSSKPVEKKLWIYNMEGQQLFSLQTYQPIPQCCPRKLSGGAYLLVAQENDQWYVQRLLKR